MKIKNKKDFGLGIFCILAAALIVYLSMQLKATNYEGDPGPRMFPIVGSVIMAICGILLVIKPDPAAGAFMTKTQWFSAGKMFCVYLLTVALFLFLGFTITIPIILFILSYMLSKLSAKDISPKKRLISSLIFAVVGGALVYLAYVVGLQASLPEGLLFELF